MRTALGLHRQALLLSIAVLVSVVLAERDAGAFHDERGGHIDQVSIDMGPPGVAVDVDGNGKPAVGERDGDNVPDAEGYDTPHGADAPGFCGNGVDDDPGDLDGDTVPDPRPDGVADDGCQVTLTPLERCAEIIDDDVLNADEDFLVAGQDRLSIDITVGAQPGPGGGIPAERRLKSWHYGVAWDNDVIDVDTHNPNFLILAAGGAQPYSVITSILPDLFSPFLAEADDLIIRESGAGVVARLSVEGNGAGFANLRLIGVRFDDARNEPIPVHRLNMARVAVSKDVNGDTVIAGPKEVFRCCPAGFVHSPRDSRKACGPRGP